MTERHAIRKVKEVLRLAHVCGLSQREIATALCISTGSVSGYIRRAAKEGLTWDVAESLSDSEVEQLLFRQIGQKEPKRRLPINFEWVNQQMKQAGVTLRVVWDEYLQTSVAADSLDIPYQYSQFCELYRGWRSKLNLSMRQIHRAGEKAFIDYSGVKVGYVDRETGERVECELQHTTRRKNTGCRIGKIDETSRDQAHNTRIHRPAHPKGKSRGT